MLFLGYENASSRKQKPIFYFERVAGGHRLLGILASLLPALGKAKAAAKRIDCSNNLRQIALASHMFSDDHDGGLFSILRPCPLSELGRWVPGYGSNRSMLERGEGLTSVFMGQLFK